MIDSTIASRIDGVDRDAWTSSFADADDAVFASHEFLRALERSMHETSSFWHALVREGDDVVGAASFSTLRVDLALLASARTKRLIARARRLAPGLLYVTVLFCGLPVSVGAAPLAIRRSHLRATVAEMERLLLRLSAAVRPLVVCYKELSEGQASLRDELVAAGYIPFETPPVHRFEHEFGQLEDYLAALRSHYRHDIVRSMRKAERAGLRLERVTAPDHIESVYTDEVHDLYRAVVEHSEHRLELLPRSFFLELVREFGGRLSLTVAERQGRIVGFNWSLADGLTYYLLFCGIDYAANRTADVYFNVMYAELDHALRGGATAISFGQTADEFKARLGCRPARRYAYVRGRWRLVTLALRLLSPVLLPAPRVGSPHRIFREPREREADSAVAAGTERRGGEQRTPPEAD